MKFARRRGRTRGFLLPNDAHTLAMAGIDSQGAQGGAGIKPGPRNSSSMGTGWLGCAEWLRPLLVRAPSSGLGASPPQRPGPSEVEDSMTRFQVSIGVTLFIPMAWTVFTWKGRRYRRVPFTAHQIERC